MENHSMGTAPDYTRACIVMFGVNLTWILFALWAIWGLIIAGAFSYGLNHLINRLHARAVARRRITTGPR